MGVAAAAIVVALKWRLGKKFRRSADKSLVLGYSGKAFRGGMGEGISGCGRGARRGAE